MCDVTGIGEVMLGLDGYTISSAEITAGDELVLTIESTVTVAACAGCGVRAVAQDRVTSTFRDLECFGRPVVLMVDRRRWRCPDPDCDAKTWTETDEQLPSKHVLSRRAGVDIAIRVGRDGQSTDSQAKRFAVAWDTAWSQVESYGRPLVDDPDRTQRPCRSLGVDETSFKTATPESSTEYVTGMIDLDSRFIIDLVEGRKGTDLGGWLDLRGSEWLQGVRVVATDLVDSYRRGMRGYLDHAVKVADGFHVVRVAQRCLDAVRRRVQREQTGHRGRRDDPLYKTRKLLAKGDERLNGTGRAKLLEALRVGDPHDEVLGAWLAKEAVRQVYLTDDINMATVMLGRAIKACRDDHVPEIRSLGRTLSKWWTEILNHHRTGASNGPTEAMNLQVKKIKRGGQGFHCFKNYRLRVLLYAGGCDWSKLTTPTRPLRTRSSPLR